MPDEVPPLSLEEAARVLARLESIVTDRSLVLIGGQAVALWSSQLSDRFAIELEQVASKDIDFLATPADA